MQHRWGPLYNGPFGALQSLSDGMKLMFKENITPKAADRLIYNLAPFIIAVPAITAFSVIPFAGKVPLPWVAQSNRQVPAPSSPVLSVVPCAPVARAGCLLAG